MTTFVSTIAARISDQCRSRRCRKNGCTLSMSRAPTPAILIDMDSSEAPQATSRTNRCDYLFFGGTENWVVPLELKRGKPNASEIIPQLQSGANIADSLVPAGTDVTFRPVAVYGGQLTRIERNRLLARRNRIRFRDLRLLTTMVRCGTELAAALR